MGCGSSSPAAVEEPGKGALAPDTQPPSSEPRTGKFASSYRLGAKLGAGGFATVRVAVSLGSEVSYAVKIMAMPREGAAPAGDGATRAEIFNEVAILAKVQHPNCLRYKEWFLENDKALIVTNMLPGGEVLEALIKKGSYDENDARVVFRQLVSGLLYLHRQDIMHRDLKLENLLLSKAGNITEGVTIVDFGLARLKGPFNEDDVCGTPMYVAPEVLGMPGPGGSKGIKAVTVAVDMWSAGVILFMLLAGFAPFVGDTDAALFHSIKRGKVNFNDPAFTVVTDPAKDLIKSLLAVNPDKRLTADGAMKHPWMADASLAAATKGSLAAAQQGLRKIMAKRRFKGAVGSVVAVNRMQMAMRLRAALAVEVEDD